MSAKITLFPGLELPLKGVGDGFAETADTDTIARLIALHRDYRTVPWDSFDSDSIRSIQRAFTENRLRDGLDLIDILIEGLSASDGDYPGEDADEGQSPIPAAAQIFRYSEALAAPQRKLHVVGAPAAAECLRPNLCLHSEDSEDWIAKSGPLAFNEAGRAALELGLKGEVVLIVFSGVVQVATPDGDILASVASESGSYSIQQIAYCRAKDVTSPLVVTFASSAGEPARGIWCHSSRLRLHAEDRQGDPDNRDVFFVREFHPVEVSADSDRPFCANAAPLEIEDYVHQDSVTRGELARFSFNQDSFSDCDGWQIGDWGAETSITGMQAGLPPPVAPDRDRPMVVHDGMELFVAVNGAIWVAITGDRASGGGEALKTRYLLHDRHDDPKHLPAFVTALMASGPETGDEKHDVMLLKPSYNHAVWMTPGSGARFFHVCFNDPKALRPARRHSPVRRKDEDVPMPERRIAAGSKRGSVAVRNGAPFEPPLASNVVVVDFRRSAKSIVAGAGTGCAQTSVR